jgi:DNA-binding NtrC family response regulator
MSDAATILVADDDEVARELLAEVLTREGYRVVLAADGLECVAAAERQPIDLALIDLRMPGLDGLAVLRRFSDLQPGTPVVILTAFASIDTAIEAVQAGAHDYLSKPFRMEEIQVVVRRTLEARRLADENRAFREELRERYRPEGLVGQSPQMVEVYKLVARVARLDATVLIQGETGTGKELVARAIHYASARAARPFVVVDCAALPESLFESELFGHERGAFTGAVSARRGLLEASHGGTCFLDEVGELSPALQSKLLRTLQERAVRRLGGNEPIAIDARLIAATNRDLARQVAAGAFRRDLFYRLNVVTITLPPLRERAQDIALLAQHFVEHFARAGGRAVKHLAPDAIAALAAYAWPGNVRELEHMMERLVALSPSEIVRAEDLPPEVRGAAPSAPRLPAARMTLDEVKRWYTSKILADVAGNKAQAAEILGIDRSTLYRILAREDREERRA